jgi:hypothetical protein
MYILGGEETLKQEFPGSRIKITPSPKGKDVQVEGTRRKGDSAKTKSSE